MRATHSSVDSLKIVAGGAISLILAACATGGAGAARMSAVPEPSIAASPPLRYAATARVPSPDPRVGLVPGFDNAGEAIWNLRLVSRVPASDGFETGTGSDIAFTGNLAILGSYRGFQIWDITNPARPALQSGFLCPASQGDPSVHGNLLFISGESTGSRNDCGIEPVRDAVSLARFRGIRIFDISDVRNPRLVTNVQTCRGSHTHTIVTDPDDRENVYVYVSGYSSIRVQDELAGCRDAPAGDPASARFRIEIIQVPLANPSNARVVNSPHLLADLSGRTVHGQNPPATPQIGQSGCHDITAYAEIGYAAGACGGYGLLFDVRDVVNPKRLLAVADSNMSFWHSATFNNDGDKVLFSDEWGGGAQPRCRAEDPLIWGGNAIFTLEDGELDFHSYFKMPAAQTQQENCTAHNGSLIPVPGRDIMVQSFYEGGITVFDWTDAENPFEMAYYDLGPAGRQAGFWSSYWYNGVIVGSDMGRGMYIWELTPGPYLTQNEIDAAKTVRQEQFNAQDQPRYVWPPSFALARAYLDQLERNAGLPTARIGAVRAELAAAERATGGGRRTALSALAASLGADQSTAADRGRVERLRNAVLALSRVG